eukprot:m.59713 g.59713  ORF g.59713 m.59713 type:complete len:92 (-) comp17361_c0_seq1:629-904(-)
MKFVVLSVRRYRGGGCVQVHHTNGTIRHRPRAYWAHIGSPKWSRSNSSSAKIRWESTATTAADIASESTTLCRDVTSSNMTMPVAWATDPA